MLAPQFEDDYPLGDHTSSWRKKLPCLASANGLDKEMTATSVEFAYWSIGPVKLLLTRQIVQHIEYGMRLLVLCLLLVCYHLLVRADDKGQLGFV